MRNPNNYGSITKLSGKRRKPWMVREGISGRQRPIGYAATKEEALIMLAEYNSEPWDIEIAGITFEELYKLWMKKRMNKLGESSQSSLKTAYKRCEKLYKIKYKYIKVSQMQDVIDECPLSYSSKAGIKSLFTHLDKFAMEMDVIVKMNSTLVSAGKVPDSKKVVFTEKEIERIWERSGEWIADCTLILLYTGFRISELLMIREEDIDLENDTMTGGVKTAAGRNRIIPIHPRIREIVTRLMGNGYLVGECISSDAFRVRWNEFMDEMDMHHTPHECRHTFRSRMDSAGANKVCIDLIMGHKSRDVGERIYTHKRIEELKNAILSII